MYLNRKQSKVSSGNAPRPQAKYLAEYDMIVFRQNVYLFQLKHNLGVYQSREYSYRIGELVAMAIALSKQAGIRPSIQRRPSTLSYTVSSTFHD